MNNSKSEPIKVSFLERIADILFNILDFTLDVIQGIAYVIFFILTNPRAIYFRARELVTPGAPFTWRGLCVSLVCSFIMVYVIMGVARCFTFIVFNIPPGTHRLWVDWWWILISKIFV